jgi:hypothetical protein
VTVFDPTRFRQRPNLCNGFSKLLLDLACKAAHAAVVSSAIAAFCCVA